MLSAKWRSLCLSLNVSTTIIETFFGDLRAQAFRNHFGAELALFPEDYTDTMTVNVMGTFVPKSSAATLLTMGLLRDL